MHTVVQELWVQGRVRGSDVIKKGRVAPLVNIQKIPCRYAEEHLILKNWRWIIRVRPLFLRL